MSEEKFTPGPWFFIDQVGGGKVLITDHEKYDGVVMEPVGNRDRDIWFPNVGGEADAYLIEAAPDLYEELEDSECPDIAEPGSANLTVGRCYELGRCDCTKGAAIAKALGENTT